MKQQQKNHKTSKSTNFDELHDDFMNTHEGKNELNERIKDEKR